MIEGNSHGTKPSTTCFASAAFAVLNRRSQTLRATEQTHQQEAHQAAEQRDKLERQEAAELARLAEFTAAASARAAAERQAAAQVTAAASATVAVTDADLAAAAHAVNVAETASAPGRARVSRVEKQAAKDKTPAQAAATKASAASRTKEICEEATYPIPWVAELEIAGVRMPPPFVYVLQRPSTVYLVSHCESGPAPDA